MSYETKVVEAFKDELVKIKMASVAGVAAPMVAGAALFEWARRANQDRKMGKAVRTQQGGGY